MPRSMSRARSRLVCAGLTTGAVAAALLVAPQAAFADVAVAPPVGPVGTSVTITDTTTSPFTGTPVVELQTAACTARYTAPTGATIVAATNVVRTGTTQVSFTVPSGVATTNGVYKSYNVCVYDTVNTTTSNPQGSGYTFTVGIPPTLSSTLGPSAGGNSITVTGGPNGPLFTGVPTVGATFNTTSCAATYGSPAANLSTTVTKTSDAVASLTVPAGVTSGTAGPTAYNLCLYSGNVTGSTLLASVPYSAGVVVPSQSTGPSGGGNALSFTAPTALFAGLTTLGVSFTNAATCGANYDPANSAPANVVVPGNNVRKMTNSWVAVTVPALTQATYQACIYNGNTGAATLVASTPYTGATVQSATNVTPIAGPAVGGNPITVSGSNFPTAPGALTATLGGVPLTNIVVTNSSGFTAVAPARAPGRNVALVVTTAVGQFVLPNAYTFTNSIEVEPNTAPNTVANVDVIVKGIGFQSTTWNSGNLTGGHVYLVDGEYNPSGVSGARVNAPVAECTNVLAFSDNALVCSLQLDRRLNPAGTDFFVTPAARTVSLSTVNGNRVVTGTAFTAQEIGLTVSGNVNIPGGATITDVLSPTQAILSTNATATANTVSSTLGMPVVRTATIGVTDASTTITGTFTAADVGRRITAALGDIPDGTTIVSQTGSAAVLSQTTAGTVSGPSISADIFAPSLPVPEGAYNMTYVTNGGVDAATTDPNYSQSAISSGSTFTVANF